MIHHAWLNGVKKLLFLGSSCIYPKLCPQPIKEEYLLTGKLEPSNDAYAVAKIAGIKTCQSYNQQYNTNFIAVMPTNLYGPFDNFDLETSHVLPAMIRKFHDAKEKGHTPVSLWGTGKPMREFLYSEDMAEGCVYVMNHVNAANVPEALINTGTGKDIAIKYLASKIQSVVGHTGEIAWDPTRPDGTPRKLLDTSLLTSLGWTPKTKLDEGLNKTYQWFSQTRKSL